MDITCKITTLVSFFLVLSSLCFSQDEEELIFYTDQVYHNNIKTVQFRKVGIPESMPVIPLDGSQSLRLEFDDLDGDYKRYTYTVVHCNRDWSPSEELVVSDYLVNFEREEIREYNSSFGTFQRYTNYELTLPNSKFNWSLTGNYVLLVFLEDSDKVVLSKRFVVYQRRIPIASYVDRPTRVNISKTHQEVEFYGDLKDVFLDDPLQNIEATIIQNTNWYAAIEGVVPKRITGDRLMFDYPNRIVFPAGKPFRIADLRSAKFRYTGVYAVETYDNVVWVTMETDRKRIRSRSIDDFDIDGSYVVENADQKNARLRSEYLNVMFTLESQAPFFDKEVYILGRFNDFTPSIEYKMNYLEDEKIYAVESWFKQGVYDYYYGVAESEEDFPEWTDTEGDWNDTFNAYHIFFYYRPFGGRYDEVIGYSVNRN